MMKNTPILSIYSHSNDSCQKLTEEQQAIMNAIPILNADSVRRYVAAKWPMAMQSPLAQAMHGASAMAMLESSDADAIALRSEARAHAESCLVAVDGWTVETLGHNIESEFGMELDSDECNEIASAAMAKAIK